MLGAAALLSFAGVTWVLLPRVVPALAMVGASAAWLVTALALYVVRFGRSSR